MEFRSVLVRRYRALTRGARVAINPLYIMLAAIGAATQLWAPHAVADDESQSRVTPASEVETITVTARRREEDSQDVPIPIATLGGDAIDKSGVFRFEDLNQHFPSTNIQFANPRQTSIAVRGLGNNPANDALESSVGVYLDDVYLGRPGMANQDLIDIAQITLLRGPQGTLFGKNTTGGVLAIMSREPSFTPEARLESSVGQYGDNDYYQLRGAVSGALLEDELAGRLSFAKTFRDGFVDDVTDGRLLNGTERKGTRTDLLYTPTETLRIRLIGDYSTEDSDCCASVLYSAGPNGGALYFSRVAAAGGTAVLDPDYKTVTLNTEQHMKVRQGGVSLKADWDIGDYTLTSITAYRDWNFWPTNDADGISATAIINAGQHVADSQWSQELRLASATGGPIDWVAGLYCFFQDQNNVSYTYYGPDAGAFLGQPVLNNGTVISHQDLNTDSYSAFAQATWHATDRIDLTAGIRETYEEKTTDVFRYPGFGNAGIAAAFPAYATGKLDVSDTRPSGLVSVSYQLTDDVLAYTSVSSGAKAGGINPQVPARGLGVDSLVIEPEKATDTELGIKTSLFDRSVQVNANAFWTNVEDYQATNLEQISPGVFSQTLSNIGKVQTRGFELELTAIPLDGLTVGFTGSYNDATYESYRNAPCSAEKAVAGQTVCDLTGEDVVGAPKWIANPTIAYERAIGGLMAFAASDYAWRSEFFGSPDNSDLAKVDAFGVLNVRVGVSGDFGSNAWDVTLWGTNVLDEAYVVGGLGAGNYGAYSEFPGAPRAYGATFRVNFL